MTINLWRGLPVWPPKAQNHFECDLHAGGTAVGKKDVIETGGRQGNEFCGELFGRFVRVLRKYYLIESAGLRFYRCNDLRMAVAVGDDPPRGDGVENALARL